jgi:hypothetical protein
MCSFALLKEVTVGRHLEDMIWPRSMIALLDESGGMEIQEKD